MNNTSNLFEKTSRGRIFLRICLLFITALLHYQLCSQTTRTWNASGAGNWSTPGNWSPVGVPGTNDIAIFDNTSDFDCNIDIDIQVDNISVEVGYDGIITQNSGSSIQIDLGANFQGGTFIGGDDPINIFESFTLDGTVFTSTSDSLSFFEGGGGSHTIAFTSGTFNHNNGEVLFSLIAGPMAIDGDFNFYNMICLGFYRTLNFNNDVTVTNDLTIDNTNGSITLDLNDTLTVQGDLILQGSNDNPVNFNSGISGNGTLKFEGTNIDLNAVHDAGGGTASLYISGSGTQNLNGPAVSGLCPLPHLKIECNTLNLTGYATLFGNTWEYVSGTLNYPSNFELQIVGSGTVTGNSHTLDSLTITGNYTTTSISAPLTINGDLEINSDSQTEIAITAPLDVLGDINLNTTAGDGNIDLTIASNNKTIIRGNYNTFGGHDVSIDTDTLAIEGNVNIANTGTGGGGSGVMELSGTTQTYTIDSGVNDDEGLVPSLYINTSNTLNFSTGSTFNLTGTWNYEQGTLNFNGATMSVNAANNGGNHIRIMGNPHVLSGLNFRGTYGFLDIEADITLTGDLSIESDPTAGTAFLTLTDELFVGGNYSTSGNDAIFINSDTITVAGNLDIKNTGLGGGSGAIEIVGTGAQLFSGGTQHPEGFVPDIIINKPSGVLTLENFITVDGDWTLNDGVVDTRTNGSALAILNVGGAASLDLTSPDGTMNLDTLIVDATRFGLLQINANLDIRGDLIILDTRGLDSNSFDISIGGNWINNNTTDDGFDEGTGNVTFNGSTTQTISCSACTAGEVFYDLEINNSTNSLTSRDVFLDNNVQITNSLVLTDGVVETDTDALLNLTAGASVNLGSSQAYINGRVSFEKASTGTSNLNFPIGKADNYRPAIINVNHSAATSYTYTSEVINSSASALGYGIGSNLNNVSYVRYWDIDRSITGGANTPSADLSGNASITLFYDLDDEVDDYTNLVVAKYDGSTNWENIGGTASGNGTGSVVSTSTPVAFSAFTGEFTIANNLAGSNPLPVELLYFRILRSRDQPILQWATSTEINNSHFLIERSSDGIHFEKIAKMNGQGNSNATMEYSFQDRSYKPHNTLYYQLKQIDFDGKNEVLGILRTELIRPSEEIFAFYDAKNQEIMIRNLMKDEHLINIHLYDSQGRSLGFFSKNRLLNVVPVDKVLFLRIETSMRSSFLRFMGQ
ncbi:MAG: hypothetical protein RIM99_19210 [Cyclobacteriaceae bacterium]